ncbi:hypothetical protein [Plantibacter sp. ME-Dv--P-095]|uniref:hypothetical protein n=1 Tax=Plantibacter sp. ME-Dv--P-095 TaxID=3040299 RepID=UPI0025505D0F|nr:hypothetical protein [Plantibacter sp. ME-Dv--P-095]
MSAEHMQQLVDVARAEYGELIQDALYYPGSGQLTVILVGNERAVYRGDGERIWPNAPRVNRRRRTR